MPTIFSCVLLCSASVASVFIEVVSRGALRAAELPQITSDLYLHLVSLSTPAFCQDTRLHVTLSVLLRVTGLVDDLLADAGTVATQILKRVLVKRFQQEVILFLHWHLTFGDRATRARH